MKLLQILPLFLVAALVAGCGSPHNLLKTKKAPGFRLSDYSTFGFYDIEASGDTIPEAFEQNLAIIKSAISKNLQDRGLDEARDAALKVNIAISVENKVQTRQTDFRTDGLPRYMGQRRYSWKSEEVPVRKYREGTLILDLVDASNNKLVWQGGSEGTLSENGKGFAERIDPVIKEIVAQIP